MADGFSVDVVIDDEATISIVAPPTIDVNTIDPPFSVVVVPGSDGAPGPAGPAFNGAAWWYGEGPPNTVIGSKAGDYYVDTLTGTIYELQVGS